MDAGHGKLKTLNNMKERDLEDIIRAKTPRDISRPKSKNQFFVDDAVRKLDFETKVEIFN